MRPDHLRTNFVPMEFLAAELAAFPIASESALGIAPPHLDPALDDKATRDLWRDAESLITAGRPALSLDEAVLIRDDVWFEAGPDAWRISPEAGPRPNAVTMLRYVDRLADRLLEVRGGDATPRPAAPDALDPAAARRRWMWHEVTSPPELLLASLEARSTAPHALTLRLVSQPIAALLAQDGFAETHVHLGASLDFELIWVAALLMIPSDRTGPDVFASAGAAMGEGRRLGEWVLRAAAHRWTLATFLAGAAPGQTLHDFLRADRHPAAAAGLSFADAAALRRDLQDFAAGRPLAALTFAELQGVYRTLRRSTTSARPADAKVTTPGGAADPVSPILGWTAATAVWPERLLTRRALAYAAAHEGDAAFAAVLWQLVRVRGVFYRHFVMRPVSRGLQQFVRYFGRSSSVKGFIATGAKLDSALGKAGGDHGVRSFEFRQTPDETLRDVQTFFRDARRWADATRAADPRHAALEVGAVVHFNRLRGKRWTQGLIAAAEVDTLRYAGAGTPFRFQEYYAKNWRLAGCLVTHVGQAPEDLQVWRGIDCCTDEQGIPAWILQPIFRWVRAAARRAAPRGLPPGAHPLHATAHAGEDFIHLLTGIRLIHESIRAFGLEEGDRVGHGLALGVDPAAHCGGAGRIAISREQRLLDLVWLIRFVGDDMPVRVLEDEAITHARDMFAGAARAALDWRRLVDFYERLWRPVNEAVVATSDVHPLFTDLALREDELFRQWMCDFGVHVRARSPVWVSPARDVPFVAAAQSKLRRQVGRLGLTIEVNPTSNLLIGDLGDLSSHPLWRLRPVAAADGRDDAPPPLSICVGTDDPLIIASSLPVEYQRLADAMAAIGLPEEQRRSWIARTVRSGLESRFTLKV